MTGKPKEKFFEQGVSETVGFIIIFGIVMTGIGLVTVYGYPLLLQEQANANIRNMEKNMIVLQSDLNSLTFKNVPYQETTMQVSGGVIKPMNASVSTQSFGVYNSGGDIIPDFYLGELQFTSDDLNSVITLENGAVHKKYWNQPHQSVMLSKPRWYYDAPTQTFVMALIQMQVLGNMAQTGIGTVQMNLLNSPDNDVISIPIGDTVTIEYNADFTSGNDYNIAWKNYFESPELGLSENPTSSAFHRRYNLNSNVRTLVIKRYYINIISV